MKKDNYKIPLLKAQTWCENWIHLKDKEKDLAESDKYNPKEMRAFLVAKEDLLELFEQVEDAQYVRFYIGIHEETEKYDKVKKIPHLLMVNARGTEPKNAKDVVGEEGDGTTAVEGAPVNDFSHPCPQICDTDSPLYVP
ncbi:hypothetical protein SAMN06298216_4294 [Spirosomataceae bacterium TFI 002]|nr:hypothetical protein SAMN06298216_4294 [Spirosomataceae bacterium TFI 002]